MIHHCSIGVRNLEQAGRFYDGVLGCLGFMRTAQGPSFIGYGIEHGVDPFYIALSERAAPPGPGAHIAFSAPDRAAVGSAYDAALRLGGTDNGPPGVRDQYGPCYFAAFVVDLDGNRIEFVHDAGL